jgi:tetratricopeptide (TPR) repeat protein
MPVDFLDNPLIALPAHLRLINAGEVALRYLFLLVFPYRLCADYSYNALPVTAQFFSRPLAASALLGLAVFFLGRRFWQRPSLRSFSGAWLLFCFAPFSNAVVPIGTIMAERLLYLPSVGFCLLAARLLLQIWETGSRRICLLACAALVLLFVGRTWVRNADWRSNESLFRAAVAAQPRSAKAHHGLGEALLEKGDRIGALLAFARALEIYPVYWAAHYNRGLAHWRLGQQHQALEAFAEAVRLGPQNASALLNLGAALHALGRPEEAAQAYERVVRLKPDYGLAWENLGHTYWELGQSQEAAQAYGELLRLQPDHPQRGEYQARIKGE